jgi:hypothetical protein
MTIPTMGIIEIITWAAEDGKCSIENKTSSGAMMIQYNRKTFTHPLDPKYRNGLHCVDK